MSKHLVFIHNPKTGGASFRKIFPSSYTGHNSLDDWYGRNKGQMYRPDLFVAAFIRNPWERLHSWYHHSNYHRRQSFEEYVITQAGEERYRAGRIWTRHLIARQEPWVESDIRPLDFIGRFENLVAEWGRLYREVGKTGSIPEFPHTHKSLTKTTPHSMDLWTPRMLEVVAPMFEPFAERYGYG